MSSNKIVLNSSDGQSFEMDEAVAREFQGIAHMIEDGCANKAISLENVTGNILALVIEYCKKHVEAGSIEEEEEEAKKKLDDWDTEFLIKLDLEIMLKLIAAANFLDIESLLDIVCHKIADIIKDKKPEEIREMFNIENVLTPEEEAKIRQENPWVFE